MSQIGVGVLPHDWLFMQLACYPDCIFKVLCSLFVSKCCHVEKLECLGNLFILTRTLASHSIKLPFHSPVTDRICKCLLRLSSILQLAINPSCADAPFQCTFLGDASYNHARSGAFIRDARWKRPSTPFEKSNGRRICIDGSDTFTT